MRKAWLLLCLVLLPACDSSSKSAEPGHTRERTNAVKSTTSQDSLIRELCDSQPKTALEMPALINGAPLQATKGWHWINVWATWCKPCVEEMPRLRAWQDEWRRSGAEIELSFVSADTDVAAVEAFMAKHPEARGSLQMTDIDETSTWLAKLGVETMSLPVHVFVDGEGNVRCVRASSIDDADERAVRALIQ